MGPANRVNRRGRKNVNLWNLEDLENDVKQWLKKDVKQWDP